MATRATYFPELLVGIRKPSTDAMLNAGTVTFYEAGTTTLKTVWNDAAKTSAADNPKTLSAYGTASVYGDGIYKLVIKDSAGNTVYTWDNYKLRYYNVSVLSKSADYAATTDDDLILVDTSGGDVTITLPDADTASTPLYIKKTSSDTNSVVIAAASGDLVDGAASTSFSAEGYTAAYFSDGSSNWYGSADSTDATSVGGYSPTQTPAASKIVVSQAGSTFIHDDWVDWSTKAGSGLAFSASDPTSGVLSVGVDNSTIEINADSLRVKAGGIGTNEIATNGVGTDEIANGAVTAVKLTQYLANSGGTQVNPTIFFLAQGSNSALSYNNPELRTNNGGLTKMIEYMCPVGGTLYSTFTITGADTTARVYVNGSGVGTSHTAAGACVDTSITVAAGDFIQIYAAAGGGGKAIVNGWALKSNGSKMPLTLTYVWCEDIA